MKAAKIGVLLVGLIMFLWLAIHGVYLGLDWLLGVR